MQIFFLLVIDWIPKVTQSKGYQFLIFLTRDNDNKELVLLEILKAEVGDILISVLSEGRSNEHLHELKKSVPDVFFNRVLEEITRILQPALSNLTKPAFEMGEWL